VLALLLTLCVLVPVDLAAGASVRPSSSSQTQVVQNCTNYRVAPQHHIVVACADFGIFLNGLHWQFWHAHAARGHGFLVVNDCKPSCAAGHFHRYPARFLLTRARADHHHVVFHHVSTHFAGKRPPHARSYLEMQLPGSPI
jgi:hypothetical protein